MTGKGRNQLNLILDLFMLVTILCVFNVKGEAHETFAYTLGVLVTIHLIIHWKQVKVMFKQF